MQKSGTYYLENSGINGDAPINLGDENSKEEQKGKNKISLVVSTIDVLTFSSVISFTSLNRWQSTPSFIYELTYSIVCGCYIQINGKWIEQF